MDLDIRKRCAKLSLSNNGHMRSSNHAALHASKGQVMLSFSSCMPKQGACGSCMHNKNRMRYPDSQLPWQGCHLQAIMPTLALLWLDAEPKPPQTYCCNPDRGRHDGLACAQASTLQEPRQMFHRHGRLRMAHQTPSGRYRLTLVQGTTGKLHTGHVWHVSVVPVHHGP